MDKEKIQNFLEKKFGHKRLFAMGAGLLAIANFMMLLIQYAEDLKIVIYILVGIFIFIGFSAIGFASDIRHKGE